jgi:hypothetical protein
MATFLGYRFLHHIWRDLNGKVVSCSGFVETSFIPGRRSHLYFAKIDGKTFDINRETYKALGQHHYRFYYAPNSRTLLSAEVLQGDNQSEPSHLT